MKLRQIYLSAIMGSAALLIPPSGVSAQTAQQTFDQNMKNAEQAYKAQQQQQQREQMKEYQNRAGNYNPGPLDKSLGNNTYVKPSYNNGAVGGTVTKTFK
jgi:type II secretory pathway pseudopilin PulG